MKINLPAILASISCFTNLTIAAQEVKEPAAVQTKDPVTITAEANYMKHYLWRGALFGNDDVSQPFVNIGYKKFTLGLCANINLRPSKLSEEFYTKKVMYDEQDVELGYAATAGKLEFEVKAMAYIYFHQIGSPSTGEGYLKLSYPVIKNISAFAETAVDAAAYKGSVYYNAGLTWEKTAGNFDFSFVANTAMTSKKFTEVYYYAEGSGLLFTGGKLNLTHNFKNFYLTLSGEHNIYINSAVKEAAGRNNTSNFSIAIGREFKVTRK